MALNFKKDKDSIRRYSDSKVWIVQCDENGTFDTKNGWTDWQELPYISAPKVDIKEEVAELKDGSNATIYKSNTLDCYTISFDMLQANKDTIDIIKLARNKLFMLLYKVGTVGSKTQYMLFAPGNISSEGGLDYSDFTKVPFSFSSLKNDKVITFTKFPITVVSDIEKPIIPLTTSILAEEQMVIVEE